MKKALNFILPPVLWALVIFSFSSLPTITASQFYLWDFIFKKSAHFIEYGVFGTLIYRALVNYDIKKEKAIIFSIVISFLYAASDEFHQSFVPGRGPSFRDVVIDVFGAWFFASVIITKIKKLPKFIFNLYRCLRII